MKAKGPFCILTFVCMYDMYNPCNNGLFILTAHMFAESGTAAYLIGLYQRFVDFLK